MFLIVDGVVKSVGKCVGLMNLYEVVSNVYCDLLFNMGTNSAILMCVCAVIGSEKLISFHVCIVRVCIKLEVRLYSDLKE